MRERLAELERQVSEEVSRQKAAGTPSSQKGASSGDGSPGDPSAQASQSRRLAELQRQYTDELKKAAESDERLREAVVAGTGGAGSTPVGQTMVTSAPGTEAFKQDFARWETLHRELTLGLERLEASLSQRVIEKAARERLRSGQRRRYAATVRPAWTGTSAPWRRSRADVHLATALPWWGLASGRAAIAALAMFAYRRAARCPGVSG